MIIRPATSEDLPAVADMWNDMIRNSLATFTPTEKTLPDLEQLLLNREHAFLVADGQAGFVTWGPFRAGAGYRHTVEHTVIANRPGAGIGAALMKRAMKQAHEQGHHVMVAAISGANPAAQRFHSRLGFAEVGRMPELGRKADQWLDLVLMQKILIGD